MDYIPMAEKLQAFSIFGIYYSTFRFFMSYDYLIFWNDYMHQRYPMPSAYRAGVGVKFVSDLIPCHIVDVSVPKHHSLIWIRHSFNHATDLGFQVNKLVNFCIDFFLHLPHFFQ